MANGLTEVSRLKDNDIQRALQRCIASEQFGKVVCDGDARDAGADDANISIGGEGPEATDTSEGIYARRAMHPKRVCGIGHG